MGQYDKELALIERTAEYQARCESSNRRLKEALSDSVKTHWTWEEWKASRAARKAVAARIGPAIVRRKESASDHRLRAAFDGERGPSFRPSED